MALKDLVSDLSNFKYGMTSPDQVDNQIETGVDFFPNDEAPGFTPKTSLESLYNKANSEYVATEFKPASDGVFSTPWTDVKPIYPPRFQSPFMDTPIAGAMSLFNDDPFSVTLGTEAEPIRGDTVYNTGTFTIVNQPVSSWESPLIPNAHIVAQENTDPNKTFDVTTMDDMVYGGYNLPVQRSSAGNAEVMIINDKRRGVFDHLVNTTFEHQPFPVNQSPNSVFAPTYDRYFSEMSGKSIHISPGGELKAGLRYGAIHRSTSIGANEEVIQHLPQFKIFGNGHSLVDLSSPIHSTEVTLGDRYSVYSDYPDASLVSSNLIVGNETILTPWPERASTNPNNPTPYNLGNHLYTFVGDTSDSVTDQIEDKLTVIKEDWDDKFEFSKGQFKNVPSGLNQNNKFGTKSYRSVANSGPFNGNDRHPFILREVGDNWGIDSFEVSSLGEMAGGFVRGAPGITGLIDRNIQDKLRIAKFLISPQGLSFALKQLGLQALNPTIESKIWNPTSLFGVVGLDEFAETIGNIVSGDVGFDDIPEVLKGMAKAAASLAFPIGHPQRHFGLISDGRYEDLMTSNYGAGAPLTNLIESEEGDIIGDTYGRIAATAYAFGMDVKDVNMPNADTGIGFLDDYINKKITKAEKALENAQIAPIFLMSNPNRYAFPLSSAPKSIWQGQPSFTGTADLAQTDITRARKGLGGFRSADSVKRGGTFNPDSHKRDEKKTPDIKTHFALPYERLNMENSYEGGENEDAKLTSMITKLNGADETSNYLEKVRNEYLKVSKKIGETSSTTQITLIGGKDNALETLGVIKGDVKDTNVDRVNILPVLHGETKPTMISQGATENDPSSYKDFIKFMFRDVVNNKWLVFRSILSGIQDTITPQFNDHKYIGRPDTLYTYRGVTREIGFNMKTYPKTKQELPILMEKMNYLVGLCYPSFTATERMVAPFIELTIGDMFLDLPGLLGSVAVTVEDATTWEIDDGLQFPHYISTAITFKHIGKHLPVTMGKHYDLPWISGDKVDGTVPVGSWSTPASDYPDRAEEFKAYNTLAASDAASQAEAQGT